MPKQTARKCTGAAFMPYNLLAKAKRAAAGGAALPADGHDEEQDDASRDLSVSSAGVEDMKFFTPAELENKTKEELIQVVLRLQDSIQDIIAEEDDDEEFDGQPVGHVVGDEDDEEDDEDEGEYGAIPAAGVVHLDDDEEGDEDDLDEEDEDSGVNGAHDVDNEVSGDAETGKQEPDTESKE